MLLQGGDKCDGGFRSDKSHWEYSHSIGTREKDRERWFVVRGRGLGQGRDLIRVWTI